MEDEGSLVDDEGFKLSEGEGEGLVHSSPSEAEEGGSGNFLSSASILRYKHRSAERTWAQRRRLVVPLVSRRREEEGREVSFPFF